MLFHQLSTWAPRHRFHATSGNSLNQCIKRLSFAYQKLRWEKKVSPLELRCGGNHIPQATITKLTLFQQSTKTTILYTVVTCHLPSDIFQAPNLCYCGQMNVDY